MIPGTSRAYPTVPPFTSNRSLALPAMDAAACTPSKPTTHRDVQVFQHLLEFRHERSPVPP